MLAAKDEKRMPSGDIVLSIIAHYAIALGPWILIALASLLSFKCL